MADTPVPPGGNTIDGVSAPVTVPAVSVAPLRQVPPSAPPSVLKWFVAFVAFVIYGIYGALCLLLITLLPHPQGDLREWISIGLLTSVTGAVVLLGIGAFLLQRIANAKVTPAVRQRSFFKTIVVLVPGILLSAYVPYDITREPSMGIEIVSPSQPEELVAPISVTLSVQNAVSLLRKLGYRPVQYIWDSDGDGKPNDQTVTPSTTILYERQGAYITMVRVLFDDGTSRLLSRRVIIPRGVFSVTPTVPIVEKPARFSVEHLVQDPKTIQEVRWDLDGDGQTEVTSTKVDMLHTYYIVGDMEVTAIVLLTNNTQQTYTRTVTVAESPPLPFPVKLFVEPKNLIGPVPFGVIFRIETDENLKEVHWVFGDGKEERGPDLRRIGHSFEQPGIYPVQTRVRSGSGQLAEITTLVRATEILALNDLAFDGKPEVRNNAIRGEVPLSVQLTPKTSIPLIEFQWEEGEGAVVQPGGATISAVYRREGTYTLVLIAQDPEGKAMRLPIKVQVDPPAAEPTIGLQPDGGVAPLTVTFDASDTFIPPGESIAGFQWLFGDESREAGLQPHVGAARIEHTYLTPGEYVIKLTVVMSSGKEFTAERTIIVRRPVLNACFTASRTTVQSGKGIEFDSGCSSGGATSFLWDVRYDAQPSEVLAQGAEPEYIHVFDTPGSYTVSLTVKDKFNNQDRKTLTIIVEP